MENWEMFSDPRFTLRFKYPTTTPRGHAVERQESQRDDSVRVHLASRDSQELYFEIVKFLDLPAQEEYQQHKVYLEQQFDALAITGLQETKLGTLPAHTYSFKWPHRERVVTLIQRDRATYRIIYDPHSPINAQVLSTIELVN